MLNVDVTIWQRFIAGDELAFEQLYRSLVDDLYSYAMCFTTDKSLAQDAVHDVFTNIYKNRSKLLDVRNVKAYFLMCIRNRLLTLLRKNNTIIGCESLEIFLLSTESLDDEFEELETACIEKKKVKEMLTHLSPRQKEVIYCRFLKEMSYDEITEVMGIPYQAVQNLIQRALKKLRNEFKAFD